MLVNRDELALSERMEEGRQLTWAEHAEPWTDEAAVIAELEPPFNQADSRAHSQYGYMREARKRWRAPAHINHQAEGLRRSHRQTVLRRHV